MENEIEKISTEELITGELKRYLDGILSCCDFDDTNLDRYVTGETLELLEKLPENERAYAISSVVSEPDYGDINGFPYNQDDNEFLLPPTEFEIDLTSLDRAGLELENPDDFYIGKQFGTQYAYYNIAYGAYIRLDLEELREYVSSYLEDQKNEALP